MNPWTLCSIKNLSNTPKEQWAMELLPHTCHGPGCHSVGHGALGHPKTFNMSFYEFHSQGRFGVYTTTSFFLPVLPVLQFHTDVSPAAREEPGRLSPRCASVRACSPVRTHQSRASWHLTNPKALQPGLSHITFSLESGRQNQSFTGWGYPVLAGPLP